MIQRYDVDVNDPWNDVMQESAEGVWVQWEDVQPLLEELQNLRAFANTVNDALNSGDGSYRP